MTRYDEHPPELAGLSIHECTDESNACRHDRLPFDPPLAECRCWNLSWRPGKSGAVLRLPVRTCACGCLEVPSRGRRYVHGHNLRAHVRDAA